MLADEGAYIASESSFSRVLRAHGQMRHRGRSKTPQRKWPPSTHVATGPRQLWSWDLTFLASQVVGQWFYLYLILDVYSRKIVGFEVHENDSSDHAVDLLRRTALAEGIHALPNKPVLHGDNGATMKATTVLAMIHWLGLKASYSRPRVSDDNAFVEALFRTAKYRTQYPAGGFATLQDAREWARRFVTWYNHDHRHSGIRYVSPAERHDGQDHNILARRQSPALGTTHTQLAADRRRHAQSGTRVGRQRSARRGERSGFGRITQAATALTRTDGGSQGACAQRRRSSVRSMLDRSYAKVGTA